MHACAQARLAVEHLVVAKGVPAELLPRSLAVIALQAQLVAGYALTSATVGASPNQRLRILPVYVPR